MKKELFFYLLLLLTVLVYLPSNVFAVMEVPAWVQEEFRKDNSLVTGNGSGPEEAGKAYPTKITATSSPMPTTTPVMTSQEVTSVTPNIEIDPSSTPVSTTATVSTSAVPKIFFRCSPLQYPVSSHNFSK